MTSSQRTKSIAPAEKANVLSALEAAAAAATVADAEVTFDQSTQTSGENAGINWHSTQRNSERDAANGKWKARQSAEELGATLHAKAQHMVETEKHVHEALSMLHAQDRTLHEQIEVSGSCCGWHAPLYLIAAVFG
jgi:hypothetical protein